MGKIFLVILMNHIQSFLDIAMISHYFLTMRRLINILCSQIFSWVKVKHAQNVSLLWMLVEILSEFITVLFLVVVSSYVECT